MTRRRLLDALVAAVVGFLQFHPAAAATGGCKLTQVGSLPLKLVDGVPLIQAEVNGRKVSLVFDTGSNNTVLFSSALGQLGLKPERFDSVQIVDGQGFHRGEKTSINDLRIGDQDWGKVNLMVWPDERSNHPEIVGRLGLDAMSKVDLEIDLAHSIAKLIRAEDCQDADFVYWASSFSMADIERDPPGPVKSLKLSIGLNGQKTPAILASGIPNSMANVQAAKRAGVQVPFGSKPWSRKEPTGAQRRFNALEVGDETIKNVDLAVGDSYRDLRFVAAGTWRLQEDPLVVLGADFLKSHHILVSAKRSRMYFTYNGGPVFQVGAAKASSSGREQAQPALAEAPAGSPGRP